MAAILKPDRTYKLGDLTINEKIIPDNAKATVNVASWCQKGWLMKPCRNLSTDGKPRGITVHNTGVGSKLSTGATSWAEQYTRATWPNQAMAGVVVHFYVWEGDIWQNLKLSEQGWHAADGSTRRTGHDGKTLIGGNVDTIAIEVIGNSSKTEETAAKLVAELLKKFNLTIGDVYTHNWWMHHKDKIVSGAAKNCPIYILPHWDKFLDDVESNLSTSESSEDKAIYRVQVGAFSKKANAENMQSELKKKGFDGFIVSVSSSLYRVQVGAFSSRENADKYLDTLKSKGYTGFIVKA